MNKAVLALLALIALSLGGWQSPVLAQAPGFIQQYNAVCDPKSPTHCASPDSTGALPITGTISASSSVKATAAAPTYVEGTSNPVSADLSGNARVVCVSGCAGGTFNNNADAVATSATNGQSASWLYGYNGATWDRLRSDANKYLNVDIQTITASLPAGSNVIGHVITDTGSTTAVTGNVTVVQGTGTNLHAVIDTGSTTAVTGNVTVVQATASNLNAQVVGTVAHDGVGTGANPLLTGGYASAAVPADVSNDGDAVRGWYLRSGALAAQVTFGGVLATTGNGASGTGVQRVTIANDSTGIIALTTGSAQIGHLEANQSVNTAQVAGTTTAVNNGTASAGTQRVVVASDQTAFSVNASVTQATAANLNAQVAQLASVPTTATLQNAAVANANGTNLSVNGMAAAVLTVNCSACAGGTTVNFEGSEDNSNFVALQASQLGTSTIALLTTTAGITVWQIPISGLQVIRARISGYSAGTVTVTGRSVATGAAIDPDVNLAQISGTAASVNSGTKDAGTLRVVIATDQPQLTNKLLVTPDANSAVNVAQINGVIPLMGTGATGTGSQRITVATDNVAIPLWGHGATGSAVPANGVYMGISDGGTLRGLLQAANALNSTGTGIPTAQIVGQFDDASPTAITENQFGNLRMSANRNAYATLRDAAGNERGANVTSGNALTIDQTTIAGTATAVNNGTVSAGVQRVTIASDSTGQVALAAGTATVGGTFPSASATVGGTTLFTLTAANSTNATNVKASAGQVYNISGYTISATPAWVGLFNTSGTPTCTASLIQQYLIPGSTTGAGFNIAFDVPKQFSSGIGICITTGIAGTGSVAASSYVVNIDYK